MLIKLSVLLCVLIVVILSPSCVQPISHNWVFEHVIIDDYPLATYRINDI